MTHKKRKRFVEENNLIIPENSANANWRDFPHALVNEGDDKVRLLYYGYVPREDLMEKVLGVLNMQAEFWSGIAVDNFLWKGKGLMKVTSENGGVWQVLRRERIN